MEPGDGTLRLELQHTAEGTTEPSVALNLDLWSYNKPILLVRHTTTNVGSGKIDDLRLHSFFDFDVGGPTSYKDDIGVFDPERGVIMAYDKTGLSVAMTSRPQPDRWEISTPLKLKVAPNRRNLKNNLDLGPKDIATGLQWNLGALARGESKSVDIVLASAVSQDETSSLLENTWSLFDRKIR
ncbi:MAG: hypothetical protein ACXADS_12240 [Candidatus Thorarchaeota archaeon]|jgi:hypothetical protein